TVGPDEGEIGDARRSLYVAVLGPWPFAAGCRGGPTRVESPVTDVGSPLTRTVAQQYDLFQTSLEVLQKDRKLLNYGYTVLGAETYETLQQRLCLEVFQA